MQSCALGHFDVFLIWEKAYKITDEDPEKGHVPIPSFDEVQTSDASGNFDFIGDAPTIMTPDKPPKMMHACHAPTRYGWRARQQD